MLWGIAGYLTTSIILGLLIGCLVTMAIMFTFIDIIIHLIPNEMIITGLAVGIVFQLLMFGFNHIWIPLLSMVVITVIFTVVGLIIGLKKIGAGDVKLAGLMGLILVRYPYVVYAIIAMSIALIIYSIVGITIGKLTHVSMVAFAPFLMIGLLTGLMVMLIPSLIL
jgi:leader peptidase (prepilin peptidase) / N-methyltransferase